MFFNNVKPAPPDPIFGLLDTFTADTRKEKVSLMVGIYKDEHLKAELFPSVRLAQQSFRDELANYLPIDGDLEMLEQLSPIVFGEQIYGAHTAGGTGALRVGAELMMQEVGKTIYLPEQTWPNHRLVFERAGCTLKTYPYYGKFDEMIECFKKLPKKTAILLHACCHNPTGSDPTLTEWKEISRVIKEKELLPFFDCAYQGFGEGLEEDVAALKLFIRDGHQMLVAYSCSKNFSMYCQRVGALFVIGGNAAIKGHVKQIIRALYSNPPAHGAFVVRQVLKSPKLKKMWQDDLTKARERLSKARLALVNRLPGFEFLKTRRGMFSFLNLNERQVKRLIDEFAIYMTYDGRISLTGLNEKNIDYVTKGILTVCEKR
jgi:aspartate/tyrosine/aromatic aminotransferase